MQRGIIIPPALIKCDVEKNNIFIERSYTIQELQYFSLYWDKIAIPEQRAIKLGIPFEQDYVEAGIIELVQSPFHSGAGASILQKSHTYVANKKLQDQVNDWTLVNMLDSKDSDHNQYKNKDVIKAELKKLLPVPRNNIAIHDLLDFKTKRKDELIALHESLDEIYERILNSEDQDLRRKKEFHNLKVAIHSLDKTLLERFRLTSRVDHSVSLEFNETVLSDMIKTGFVDMASTTFPALTIANTIRSMLKFKFSKEWTLKSAEGNLKLDYLIKAKNNNII